MRPHELEDIVLSYLAEDDSDEPKFQSLTTIFEKAELPQEWRHSFPEEERGLDDKEAIRAALSQLEMDGMVECRWGERDYEGNYRVTREGYYSAVIGEQNLVVDEAEFTPLPSVPIPIDSSKWTGRRLREKELAELAKTIDDCIDRISDLQLPQEQLAQARSYLLAARALSEAPDPPINVISWLLAHFDRIVGIAGLLVGVASLVSSWTQ